MTKILSEGLFVPTVQRAKREASRKMKERNSVAMTLVKLLD